LSWLQLRLPCHRAAAEAIEDALLGAGALSVTLEDAGDQPLLEPRVGETPLWRELQVTGLFRADADLQGIHDAIEHVPGGVKRRSSRFSKTATGPASGCATTARCASVSACGSVRAGSSHRIRMRSTCSSTRGSPSAPARIPTTALCLEALDALPLAGRSVVDYGCGSGVLAIAAARLGAARLLAVDNDPQALAASADNAAAQCRRQLHPAHLPAGSLRRVDLGVPGPTW
jgi:ribosomal protein L11 methyltransferase